MFNLNEIIKERRLRSITYLAAPFAGSTVALMRWRKNMIDRAAGVLLLNGITVYSPISHYTKIALVNNLPETWDFWVRPSKDFLDICTNMAVLELPGWEFSTGVRDEVKHWEDVHKDRMPIVYIPPQAIIKDYDPNQT